MKRARLNNDRATVYECRAQLQKGIVLIGLRAGEILVYWLESDSEAPPGLEAETDRVHLENMGTPFERVHAMLDAALMLEAN